MQNFMALVIEGVWEVRNEEGILRPLLTRPRTAIWYFVGCDSYRWAAFPVGPSTPRLPCSPYLFTFNRSIGK